MLELCQRCGNVELNVTSDSITLFAYFLYPESMTEVVKDDFFDEISGPLGNVRYPSAGLHVVDQVVVSPRREQLRKPLFRALRAWQPRVVTFHRRGLFREYKQKWRP